MGNVSRVQFLLKLAFEAECAVTPVLCVTRAVATAKSHGSIAHFKHVKAQWSAEAGRQVLVLPVLLVEFEFLKSTSPSGDHNGG